MMTVEGKLHGDILVKWKEVQKLPNIPYPNVADANDLYNDSLARYFRQELKKNRETDNFEKVFEEASSQEAKYGTRGFNPVNL